MKKIGILLTLIIVTVGCFFTSCQKSVDNSAADIQALKASVTALQKRSDSLAAALAITNSNIGSLGKSVDSIRIQLTGISYQIGLLTTQLTMVNANVTAINTQITELNQKYIDLLAKLNGILTQLTNTTAYLNTRIDSLSASIVRMQKTSDSLKNALANTNNNLSIYSRSVDTIKIQLVFIVTQINQFTIQLNTTNANIPLINAQLTLLNQQYADLLAKLNAILALLDTSPTTISDGLVSWYSFAGNSIDSGSSGINGLLVGGIYSTDRFGNFQKAITVNASNQYVRTNSILNNITNTFSFSVWVNPQANDQIKNEGITGIEGYGTQSVIHPSHGGNWGDVSLNAGAGLNVGKNQIQIIEHSHLYISSPLVYSTNITGWHNIIVVYNSHTPSLYLDGTLVRVGLKSNIQNIRPSNGFCSFYSKSGFGSSFNPNGTPVGQFQGQFDDIKIYNRALIQSEITYLATH